MKTVAKILILLLFISFVFSSCTQTKPDPYEVGLSRGGDGSEMQSGGSSISDFSDEQYVNRALPEDAIEVLWQIPAEPVRTYFLSYGTSPESMTRRIPLSVYNLEKVNHPVYGPSYRYVLRGVDPNKKIYIRLVAENVSGESEPSEAFTE